MTVERGARSGPEHGGSWLIRGGLLKRQSLTSAAGRFTLTHSIYEPLTLYDNELGEAVWTAPGSEGSECLSFGPDGNLVVWDSHRELLWSTDTAWIGAELLKVRDDGDVVLLDGTGTVVWTTGTRAGSQPASASVSRVARGATMHRGQTLQRQSLTSDDGSTVFVHRANEVGLFRDRYTNTWWTSYTAPGPTYLILDDDGMLRVRAEDGSVVQEIAGPGEELVVIRGEAQLRDRDGKVVWSSYRGSRMVEPPLGLAGMPSQTQLACWVDALVGADRGYSAVVVRDIDPLAALHRYGVPDEQIAWGSWAQLQARRGHHATAAEVVVAAVALGPHTLLLADCPDSRSESLSAGTVAVTSTLALDAKRPGREDADRDFTVHGNGKIVAHLCFRPPKRKGLKVPEVVRAMAELRAEGNTVIAHSDGLELMCRVAGVAPTATVLGGELLGGVLTRAGSLPTEAVGPSLLAVSTTIPAPSADYESEYNEREFRILPQAVAEMQANLATGNMSFHDFADSALADQDRIHRGFL